MAGSNQLVRAQRGIPSVGPALVRNSLLPPASSRSPNLRGAGIHPRHKQFAFVPFTSCADPPAQLPSSLLLAPDHKSKKSLTATLPTSEFELTHSQQRTSQFSNRNKNGVLPLRGSLPRVKPKGVLLYAEWNRRAWQSLAASRVAANRNWCQIEIASTHSQQRTSFFLIATPGSWHFSVPQCLCGQCLRQLPKLRGSPSRASQQSKANKSKVSDKTISGFSPSKALRAWPDPGVYNPGRFLRRYS